MSEKTSGAVPPATQYRCACPAAEAYYRGAEQKIHGESVGLTTKFNRYTFLGAYSTLLGFILYTYYHLKLEESREIELVEPKA